MNLNFFGIKLTLPKKYMIILIIMFIFAASVWGWYLCSNEVDIIGGGNEEIILVTHTPEPGLDVLISTPEAEEDGIVNINSAGLEELQTLYGIGTKKAQEIVKYRESFGQFECIEDIQSVKGIGPKTFERIKEQIVTE